MFGFAGETEFDLRFYLFRIPIRIHPMFWLSSAWMVWDPENLGFTAIGILCMLVSVLVHELGHAFVLRKYGFPSEIVLYFLGGYATSTGLSFWRRIYVSAAGPAAGLTLAAVCYMAYWYMLEQHFRLLQTYPAIPYILGVMLFLGIIVNLINLVPCLPLDGGNIMAAIVGRYGPRGRGGTELTLQISIATAGAVAVWSAVCLNSQSLLIPLHFFAWLPEPHSWMLASLQPDPKFNMIFFGLLCAQSVIEYNNFKAWR